MAYYRMRVHVQDQDGNPVKDVKVSMPGTAYPISHTDSSGNAYFYDVISGQQFKYVATAPYGYTCITCTSYNTIYGNTFLVLKLKSTVAVCPKPYIESIGFSPASPKVGDNVSFWRTAEGGGAGQYVTARKWDFGDGRTATTSRATHAYTSAGTYTVRYTVTNNCGESTYKETVVKVTEAVCPKPYIESIGFSPASPKVGDNVSFWRTAEGGGAGQYVTARKWDFGDGRTATTSRATHAYTSAGTYTVRYTVTNNCGESTYKETVVEVKPVCTEGEKRNPKTCWDGSKIYELVCRDNRWVSTGEKCPEKPPVVPPVPPVEPPVTPPVEPPVAPPKYLTYEEALARINAGLPVYIKFDIPILDMLPAVAWALWMPVLPGMILTTEP